jgi:hypothetical protein
MVRSARHVGVNTHPASILTGPGGDVKSARYAGAPRAKGLAPARALCYSPGHDCGSEARSNYPPGVTPPDDRSSARRVSPS